VGLWSGLLSKLKKGLMVEKEPDFIFFNVKCNRCGEEIQIKVNRRNDLQNLYKDSRKTGPAYILTKEALGKKCPNLMKISVKFDENYRILSKKVSGAKFISLQKEAKEK